MALDKFRKKFKNSFDKQLIKDLDFLGKEIDNQSEDFDLDSFFLLLGEALEKSSISVLVSIFSNHNEEVAIRYLSDASETKNLRKSFDFFFLNTKIPVDINNYFSKYYLNKESVFIPERQKDIYKVFREAEKFLKNDHFNSIISPIFIRGDVIGFFEFISPKIKKDHKEIFFPFVENSMKNISSCIIFKELKKTEEKYSDIFENSDEGFYIIDAKKKKFIDCNKAMSKMSGYTKQELLQMNYIILFHPKERDLVSSYVKARLELGYSEKSPKSYETTILCKNGESKEVRLTVSRLLSKSEWFVMLSDITTKKRSEKKIKKLNENLININKIIGVSLEDYSFDKKINIILSLIDSVAVPNKKIKTYLWIKSKEKKGFVNFVSPSDKDKKSKIFLDFQKHKLLKSASDQNEIIYFEGKTKKEINSKGKVFSVNSFFSPLIQRKEVLGILEFSSEEPIDLGKEEIDFFKSISNVFSVTIDREMSRQELESSEEKYRDLVDNAVDMFVVLDLEKNIIFSNKSFDLGFSSKFFRNGGNFLDLLHGDYTDFFNKEYDNFLKNKKELRIELRTKENKKNIFVSAVFTPIIKNNKKIATQAIIRDVTETKIAEQETHDAKNHYLNVIDTIREGIFTVNEKGSVLSYNRFFADKVGLAVDTIKNKPCEEVLSRYENGIFQDDDMVSSFSETIKKVFKDKEHLVIEKNIFNGKERYYKLSISPTKNKKGEVYQVVVTISDITENRKAKEEIRRLDEFKHRVLDNVPFSIALLDKKGKIISLNRQGENILGRSFIGKKLTQTKEIKNNKEILVLYKKLLKKGESFKYENISYFDSRKNKTSYLNIIAAPLLDAQGGVEGAISMAVDNTEAVEYSTKIENLNTELEKKVLERTAELDFANKKLNRALDLKLKFISDASHELRTPLTIMKGNLDLLFLDEKSKSADVFEAYKEIEGEISRMSSIISDLTMLTNADSGAEKIEFEKVGINSLLGSVVKSLLVIAREKNISIKYQPENKEIYLKGDEARLDRVFMNLIRNAIKYTDKGGKIEISLAKDKNNIYISIKDNGIGIPDKDISLIFERFYRVDRGRSRMEGGTGLGLSISKWIVDSHGGDIKVKSKLGEGSEFIVRLPIDNRLGF